MENYQNNNGLYSKNYLKITSIVIVLCLFIGLIVFFIFNSLIYIRASGTNSQSLSVHTDTGDRLLNLGGSGLIVVPRGTNSIVASVNDYVKTLKHIHVPWYGLGFISTDLRNDLNATKYAFLSDNLTSACATYDINSNLLASYGCFGSDYLSTYTTPDNGNWQNTEIAILSDINGKQILPYNNGVIGLKYIPTQKKNSAKILAINGINPLRASHTSTYDVPAQVKLDELGGLKLFTDQTNPDNTHFVLVDKQGNTYLSSIKNGDATYKMVAAPSGYDTDANSTSCAINNSIVYCYVSNKDNSESAAQSVLRKLSFTSKGVDSKNGKGFNINSLYLTNGGDLFGASDNTLYSFSINKSGYSANTVASNVSAAIATDSLYFIRKNGVWTYNDDGSSYQIFYSPNINPTSLYGTSANLFVLGATKNGGNHIYAYGLESTPDVNPGKRLIDIMPLSVEADIKNVAFYDFVGDKFSLSPSSSINNTQLRSDFISSANKHGLNIKPGNIYIRG